MAKNLFFMTIILSLGNFSCKTTEENNSGVLEGSSDASSIAGCYGASEHTGERASVFVGVDKICIDYEPNNSRSGDYVFTFYIKDSLLNNIGVNLGGHQPRGFNSYAFGGLNTYIEFIGAREENMSLKVHYAGGKDVFKIKKIVKEGAAALTCSYEKLEGIDQHQLKIMFIFNDLRNKKALIERVRWQRKTNGREYTSREPLYAVDGYPKVKPNGDIEIKATGDGTMNFDIPETARIFDLSLSNMDSDSPTLIAKLHYSGDTWTPVGPKNGMKCSK